MITLDGTSGITTPGLTNTGTETLVNLTTTGNTILGNASTDTLNVGNGDLIKDASGNVGVGVTPSAWSTGYKNVQVLDGLGLYGTASSGGMALNCYYNGSNWISNRSSVYHQKYEANDGTGAFTWQLNAPVASGGTVPFATTAMTLDASGGLKTLNTIGVGNATPSASGAGITFPATQSASTDANTLDDYEEGTWTPNQGAGLTGTLSSSTGTYTKIGRQVYITAVYNGTTLAFTANTVISSNLPFSLAGISGAFNFGVATNANFTAFSGVGTSTSGTSLYGISALTSTAAIELSFTYIAS